MKLFFRKNNYSASNYSENETHIEIILPQLWKLQKGVDIGMNGINNGINS